MKTETEIGVMQLQAKDCQGFLAASKKTRKEAWNSANTSILDLGLQRNYFCCFKPPSLWTFVMAAIENSNRWWQKWTKL